MPITADSFRAALGRFASGVTVVSVRHDEGRDHGMTVSAFASLSLEPPLVIACIDRAASMYPLLERAEWFGVSVLEEGQEEVSRRMADGDVDGPSRFDGVGMVRRETGIALVPDALVHLECRAVARHEGGDHLILIGQVEHAQVGEGKPLLYFRGGYAALT
jgi:flavin reductase (DIM6/NTAB) family NADH-FMN oxidoreductase RutF